MKLVFGLIAMLAVAAPQQLREPAPRLERIEMESTSWGRLVSRWSIDARGNFAQTVPDNLYQPKQFVTRSYAVGTAGFRRMRVLLGLAETRGGHRMPCTQAMTDAIYGEVKWVQPGGRARTLNFYTACREYGTRQVVAQIAKARQLADEWAKLGSITETRAGDTAP